MTLDMANFFILIWFGLILFAAIIEILTMDLTSVWFAISAVIAFILALVGIAIEIQIAVFIIISIILIVSVRPLAKRYFRTNIIGTNADRLVGQTATVTKEIRPGERGEVKVDGKYWSAIHSASDIIETDEKVEILAIEGNKLIVVKL